MITTGERVLKIMAEHLDVPVERVTQEATISSLGGDSLDSVELVMAFEEDFNIQFDQDDEDNLNETTTVKQVVDMIARMEHN